MKLKELINLSKKNLQKSNIQDINIKIKLLIEYVFNIKKEQIILNYDNEIKKEKILEFSNLLDKLKNGVPIQYIINKQEFMGIDFYVNENVLIPQPDTEILVEEVIKYCNIIKKERKQKIKMLDLCTGSGAIAVSLAKYIGNAEIYATDISIEALNIAKKNAENNNIVIKFILSNMFNEIREKEFDLIVSNPPYIESSTINKLDQEVKNEPRLALDGGEDGLKFYKIISENVDEYIKQDGVIFLEIGYNQKDKVNQMFNKKYNVKFVKDLANNDRVLIIKK